MTPCDDPPDNSTTWCCDKSRSCCGSDSAVKLDRNIYTVKPSSATASSTSTPTASDAPPKSKPSGLSTGGKAGLGVGIAAGALAVFALIAWFLLRRRKDPDGNEDETSPIYTWARYRANCRQTTRCTRNLVMGRLCGMRSRLRVRFMRSLGMGRLYGMNCLGIHRRN